MRLSGSMHEALGSIPRTNTNTLESVCVCVCARASACMNLKSPSVFLWCFVAKLQV